MPVTTPRRRFLFGISTLPAACGLARLAHAAEPDAGFPGRVTPIPLTAVRLSPGPMLNALRTNSRYLMRLEPDRLLHNFYAGAGMAPKAPAYGGWEGDTIAGHTLGHYLSALSFTYAQTGDATYCDRVGYIVGELARIQASRGDGYVAGLTRKRPDGSIVDGQEIFGEIRRGHIVSGGFDLNGAWAPLYTIHKLFAGLLDADRYCGDARAMAIALRFGAYLEGVFAALSSAQRQEVLACEYGGLNESFAEFYARTGDERWLRVARQLYDDRVLDPVMQGRDELAHFHANTQIPKLVGLARIADLDGDRPRAAAARFFWERVTGHHSYVIGGNADREYFFEPDSIADHVTEQTCEHCNSYNMLRLTGRLFGQRPDGALYDYYERTHLNHIMAAQHPDSGAFTYMTPLMSGAAREYSTPFDSFWCCVGTGMESHARHGEGAFWQGEDTLLVNLYLAATVSWEEQGATLQLETRYPEEGHVALTVTRLESPRRFSLALRIPAWAGHHQLRVNGETVSYASANGYALVRRRWSTGDRLELTLDLPLRLEPAPGSPRTVAILQGPLVMAADLGLDSEPFTGLPPALVGDTPLADARRQPGEGLSYRLDEGVLRPGAFALVPFFSQHDRRSAVYFERFSLAQWEIHEAALLAAREVSLALDERTVDVMHLGEMQPERDHELSSAISYPVVYRGRHGRDARMEGFFEFTFAVVPGPLILRASYWGGERRRHFTVQVDGESIATQRLEGEHPGDFIDVDYPVPSTLTEGKSTVRVRFEPVGRHTAGPVFGVRLMRGDSA